MLKGELRIQSQLQSKVQGPKSNSSLDIVNYPSNSPLLFRIQKEIKVNQNESNPKTETLVKKLKPDKTY